ncbi:MAG: beta-lactamase family protein [Devosia sp.]|nr:beta-lactamase family protein [Devosia sp.]
MLLQDRIDAAIDAALVNRIVGCVVLVNLGGVPVYARAAGLADREAGRPMAIDAIFRLSSVTKPIVATAILALIDAGEMDLDDAVTDYVPGFRPRLADGSEPRITIRHLLTHTSGLSVASILSKNEQAAGVNRWRLGDDEIIGRLGELPLSFAPGTGWAYGPSIDVLGHIAGRLVNGRLDDALRRVVTGPLGMTDTGFAVPDRSAAGQGLCGRAGRSRADGQSAYDPELLGRNDHLRSGPDLRPPRLPVGWRRRRRQRARHPAPARGAAHGRRPGAAPRDRGACPLEPDASARRRGGAGMAVQPHRGPAREPAKGACRAEPRHQSLGRNLRPPLVHRPGARADGGMHDQYRARGLRWPSARRPAWRGLRRPRLIGRPGSSKSPPGPGEAD